MPAAMLSAGAAERGCHPVVPTSVRGLPLIVVPNASAAAASAAELREVLTFAGAGTAWAKVTEHAQRMLLRFAADATTITTSPTVQVYGAWATEDAAPSGANNQFAASAVRIARLDNDDLGAGITLGATVAGSQKVGSVYYSKWYTWNTGSIPESRGDLLGATHTLVLCSTAANVSGGNAASWIEALLLN